MRIFLYEWVSGGGMLGLEGAMPPSLLREGMAMARAVGEDFAKISGAEVTLLRDVRVMDLSASGCSILAVDSASERDALLRERFELSDAVLLIAPETDEHLAKVVRDAEASGARLISPGEEFVRVTGDKNLTADALLSAGVPTPEGVVLESDEPLPEQFPYPAVIKPFDGAGAEDTYLVSGPVDTPPPYAWPRRLERYASGLPCSVAVLLSVEGAVPLAPCEQVLSTDGRLRYLGGRGPLTGAFAERAQSLALRAIAALPPAVGYVGVDLVLGAAPDGSDDVVIEINPRVTTSYTGLRFMTPDNLAGAMLACGEGRAPRVQFSDAAVEFGTDGLARYSGANR